MNDTTEAIGPGLSREEAERRLAQFGPNVVADTSERWIAAIAGKLWAPLPWMLEATILLELFLGHALQALIIFLLLVFNAVLGLTQESRAKTAVAALRQKLTITASVRRDGTWSPIAAGNLAPGDLVKLALGTVVPADIRVGAGSVLVDQSMLTGESLPVECKTGDNTYAGALVRRGEATGTVTATGGTHLFRQDGVACSGGAQYQQRTACCAHRCP